MTEGSVTEGSVTEGSVTEGSVTEGSVTEGSVTGESMTEESMTEGSMAEESMTEGSMAEGSMTAEAVAEENGKPGNDHYGATIAASMTGYVVQAIINNFAPLLFLTFQRVYGIGLEKIAFLVTMNFGVQLVVDLLAVRFIDRIGYRKAIVAAHVFCTIGLGGLAVFPSLLPSPYMGLQLAVFVYAIGGGLIEVLISPIVEACPTTRKEAYMSLLHSFYCWGHVAVVLVSTLFFVLFGIGNWKILACVWAVVPFINGICFTRVPMYSLHEEGETGIPMKQMLMNRMFWVFVLLMVCAGASEQAVSQWASAFAESGLHVSKTIGDLAGPCMFALFMGTSRAIYAKYSDQMELTTSMAASCCLCVISYLMISLSSNPVIGLIGCGVCGFSVGLLWPGTFSLAARHMRGGGTAMFALFALAGDVGCSAGPTFVGTISGFFQNDLKMGFLLALVFPVTMIAGVIGMRRMIRTER